MNNDAGIPTQDEMLEGAVEFVNELPPEVYLQLWQKMTERTIAMIQVSSCVVRTLQRMERFVERMESES